MSVDWTFRIRPFDPYDWLKIGDLERCPYVWGTPKCGEWNEQDEKRKILIALDRYADYLTTQRPYRRTRF